MVLGIVVSELNNTASRLGRVVSSLIDKCGPYSRTKPHGVPGLDPLASPVHGVARIAHVNLPFSETFPNLSGPCG
jgi:hypothetical protein